MNKTWLCFCSIGKFNKFYNTTKKNSNFPANSSTSKEERGMFAPRMNYEQWTPLGRGDPLKNDPTYDYVPPVLDKVQYWVDPASKSPDSQKTEILVLGISSKRPSTGSSSIANSRSDSYDPFLKFVEGPKFGVQNNYQRMSRPHYSYYSVFNSNNNNNFVSDESEYVPYTVLVPPPPTQPKNSEYIITTSAPNTILKHENTGVTIQHANLLYHSSTIGSQDEFREKGQLGIIGSPSSHISWRTSPLNIPNKLEHNSKDISSIIKSNSQFMHKGQVTDDDLDIANTYVNIGKLEAQMHSPSDVELSSASVAPFHQSSKHSSILIRPLPLLNMTNMSTKTSWDTLNKFRVTPMTLQTLQTMQTMKAPAISPSPIMKLTTTSSNSLQNLLKKETSPFSTQKLSTASTEIVKHYTKPDPNKLISTLSPTTTPITTTATSLTTDPLFKHYKQPSEPLRGPMYLIIQGHSKVKTYGPGKQSYGIVNQETNEIPVLDEKDEYAVKHLHNYNKKDISEGRLRQGRSNNLQTLSHVVQTGLGAIEFSETAIDRRKDDVQEAEFIVKYDVSSKIDSTTERYYKGIVETGDIV